MTIPFETFRTYRTEKGWTGRMFALLVLRSEGTMPSKEDRRPAGRRLGGIYDTKSQ